MDASTQAILAAIFSPAAIGGLVWWVLKDHSQTVKRTARRVAALEVAMAAQTEKLKAFDEARLKIEDFRERMAEKIGKTEGLREDFNEIRTQLIKTDSKVDAAWRAIES